MVLERSLEHTLQPVPVRLRHDLPRPNEMAVLNDWLAKTQDRERCVGFIAGEPGIGKSTLVAQFLRSHPGDADILGATGYCIEPFAGPSPFLPILDALTTLCRGPSGPEAEEVLRRVAPTWVQEMGLAGEAHGDSSAQRMTLEFAHLLEALSEQRPFVLVVEDAQWADSASVELLSYVASRSESLRVLVLVTYRPMALTQADHPLHILIQELSAKPVSKTLVVRGLPVEPVLDYLSNAFPGLTQPFKEAIHVRTGGHPLFLTQLLSHLQSTGAIEFVQSVWREAISPEQLHTVLPDGPRQLIEWQYHRLPLGEQRVTDAASVVGVEFDAAAIAAVLSESVEWVEERCEALQRRECFIRRDGSIRNADGQQCAQYRFEHALFKDVLYGHQPPNRLQRIHRQIAERLEKSFDRDDSYPTELGEHWLAGGEFGRAVGYLLRAARDALERYAHADAVRFARRLIEHEEHHVLEPEVRLELHLILAKALAGTEGHGHPEVQQSFDRAYAISQQLDLGVETATSQLGLWLFNLVQAEYSTALQISEDLVRTVERSGDAVIATSAYCAAATPLLYMGRFSDTRMYMEQVIASYEEAHTSTYRKHIALDPAVLAHAYSGVVNAFMGHSNEAFAHSAAAVIHAKQLGHPDSLAFALFFSSMISGYEDRLDSVVEHASQAVEVAEKYDLGQWILEGSIMRSCALASLQRSTDELDNAEDLLSRRAALGMRIGRSMYWTFLARSNLANGRVERAEQLLCDASALGASVGENWFASDIFRMRGEVALLHRKDSEAARKFADEAAAVAVALGAPGAEARAREFRARLA